MKFIYSPNSQTWDLIYKVLIYILPEFSLPINSIYLYNKLDMSISHIINGIYLFTQNFYLYMVIRIVWLHFYLTAFHKLLFILTNIHLIHYCS